MKHASTEIIHKLQALGYRITKARTEVVTALLKAHTPKTIQELCKLVTVDEVSVYRSIAVLRQEGFIEEITIQAHGGSVSRYALSHGHHHHIVCTSCQKVAHVACSTEEKAVRHHPGFKEITSHEVTYYGLCTACV